MKVIYESKEMDYLTVKELYELCKAAGKEDAVIGCHHYNVDIDENGTDYEICEPIMKADVKIGGLYETRPLKFITDAVWLELKEG